MLLILNMNGSSVFLLLKVTCNSSHFNSCSICCGLDFLVSVNLFALKSFFWRDWMISSLAVYIWDNMCRKNSDKIHVLFSPSLWLQSALLCHPGSLELVCSWTIPQCESPFSPIFLNIWARLDAQVFLGVVLYDKIKNIYFF